MAGEPRRLWNGLQRCMDASQRRDLARYGHEIGPHTISHPDLTRLSPAELDRELCASKNALEDLLGQRVTSFAYPKGRWNGSVRGAVERAGFHCAVTVREGLLAERDVDWLTVPRVWINPTMATLQYRAKLSNA